MGPILLMYRILCRSTVEERKDLESINGPGKQVRMWEIQHNTLYGFMRKCDRRLRPTIQITKKSLIEDVESIYPKLEMKFGCIC